MRFCIPIVLLFVIEKWKIESTTRNSKLSYVATETRYYFLGESHVNNIELEIMSNQSTLHNEWNSFYLFTFISGPALPTLLIHLFMCIARIYSMMCRDLKGQHWIKYNFYSTTINSNLRYFSYHRWMENMNILTSFNRHIAYQRYK